MRNMMIGLAAAFALGAAGCAQLGIGGSTAAGEFVPEATSSNNLEIRSSQLALTRSRSPQVRQFANQMIEDHTMAAQQMKAAASAAGVAPPSQALQPRHQRMMDTLQGTSAAEFDAAYVEMQTAAHEEAITLFSAYAEGGDAPALRSFAQATLPTLQQHYDHAEMLSESR